MVRLLFKIGVALAIMLAAKPVTAADAAQETYSWTGPYVGINLGGAKGNSTAKDLSPPPGYNNLVGETWSFRNHGFTGGAQAGYNLQGGAFLLGGELDLGYLGLDQSKRSPQGVLLFGGDTRAKVETDFYTAARLRIGLAANTVLLYGTGGWIGVDTETSVVDPCNTPLRTVAAQRQEQRIPFGLDSRGRHRDRVYPQYQLQARIHVCRPGNREGKRSWRSD